MGDFYVFGSGGLQEAVRQIFTKLKTLLDAKAPKASGVYYGKCTTAAATQAKVVTVPGLTALEVGTMILVWFQYAQTYNGAPTLNVNSLGAKNIGRVSGTNAARYEWVANSVLLLMYDGTRWVIEDRGLATTSYYGVTKLATSATSTNTATALTPASLNNLAQNMLTGLPVYSASATYAVGDRVRYGYYLYECNIAITTAEAWNAEHWTQLDSLLEMIEGKLDADEFQPVAKTEAMTQPVGKDANGKLWTEPSGGGGGTPVPVQNGGTGATTASAALANLGISYGAVLPASGSEGQFFFVPVQV